MKRKLLNLLILSVLTTFFVGCIANNNSVSKTQNSYSPNMTSKQIEAQMGWEYCEQESY